MIKFLPDNIGTSPIGAGAKTDWLVSLGLAVLVIVTRLPFRTSMLYNWDSANFALGMRHFDVRVHAPHPPGYFFYVAVGNLVDALVGDANASLVILSVLFSAGAVVAVYFLGRALFGRQAGVMAALFLAFSVTFWTYGELALAYVSLAFFSSLVALFAWRIISGDSPGPDLALLISVVYGLGSGFRPDLLIFLGPLWLWSLWVHGWRTRFVCAVTAGAVLIMWYAPTALLSGGFDQYHAVLAAYTQTDVAARYSSTHRGLGGLLVNVRDTASYAFYALYVAALPLAATGLWFLTQGRLWLSRKTAFFLVWVAPMLAFYTIVHVGDPGYVFTFLPALVVLLGAFLSILPSAGWPIRRPVGAIITAIVLVANIGVFLFHPRPMTAQGIRQNDLDYREKIEFIRTHVDPRSTILLSYDSYKHLLYYLPEHRQSNWVDVYADGEGHVGIPPGVSSVLLVDARLNAINRSQRVAEEIKLPSGGRMYAIPASQGQVLTVGGKRIEVHE